MKVKATSLLLGLCLAVSVIAASPAYARSTTAFNSFHVRAPLGPTQNPYDCVTESWGAVVNNCSYEVDISFDLVIDHSVVHTVKAQNYVNGTGTTGASCAAWTFDGDGTGKGGPALVFNPNGAQTLTFATVPFGNNLSLLCNLPSGEGIGSIRWNP